MIVRIPSDYLRQKILEKNVWYVGDSMFHASQWSSNGCSKPREAIQIWAHLTGVILDLRYKEGLSLVAGLIGEPKETYEFTLNLLSLTLSLVKVKVQLSEPLPRVVEFVRQSGEVVEVQVDYPWVPPTCAHCKELGHISQNCLLLPTLSKKDHPPQSKDLPPAPKTVLNGAPISPTLKDPHPVIPPSPSDHQIPPIPSPSEPPPLDLPPVPTSDHQNLSQIPSETLPPSPLAFSSPNIASLPLTFSSSKEGITTFNYVW
ncbi:unnamed protein product [Brassica oleracea var. botrytis]